MKSNIIKVLIVDDHPIIIEGMCTFLSGDEQFSVIGTADNARMALQLLTANVPNVLVLDISLGNSNGLNCIKEAKKISSDIHVLVYTNHDNEMYVKKALEEGAKGYALKNDTLQEISEAIKAVADGRLYLSRNLPAQVLSMLVSKTAGSKSAIDELTSREFEVAHLISLGQSINEIAENLYISPKTVWVHRNNIMNKFSCKKPNELIIQLLDFFPK